MSLTGKRVVAGTYLAVLLLAAGNHFLSWHLTGSYDKKVLALVTLIGSIAVARFGDNMLEEMRDHRAKQEKRDGENGT